MRLEGSGRDEKVSVSGRALISIGRMGWINIWELEKWLADGEEEVGEKSLLECGASVSELGIIAKPYWHGRNEVEAIQCSVFREEGDRRSGSREKKEISV